jgi:hypothetical protein
MSLFSASFMFAFLVKAPALLTGSKGDSMNTQKDCMATKNGVRLAQRYALRSVFIQLPNHATDYEYLMKIPRHSLSWRLDGFYPHMPFRDLNTRQLKAHVEVAFYVYLKFSIEVLELDKELKAIKGVPHGSAKG